MIKNSKQIVKTDRRIIIKRGCSNCGHGLLINNGSTIGICVWEGKEYQLTNDFLNEIRGYA